MGKTELKKYLRAKLGTIPSDWQFRRIGEFIEDYRGGASLKPADFIDSGIKVLPKVSVVKGGKLVIPEGKQQYCSKEFADDNPTSQVDKKYLIVVLRDLVPSGPCIGLTVKIPNNDVLVLAQGVYGIIIDETKLNSEYLIQLSNSFWYRKYVRRIMVGSTQVHIRNSEYQDMTIPYPPLAEQKKIAEILSKWDDGIEKVEKLIEAKKKLKKGLMQQILTGKKRFKEFRKQPWNSIELKTILVLQIRAVVKPSKPFLALGIRSHGKGTFQKPNFEPQKIALEELYKVKTNDLIVNITFAWEGAIAIVNKCDDNALVSHRFPTYVFDKQKGIPEYFRHVILQKRFVYELGLVSPGGAGRNRVLSKKDFLKITVDIPTVEEQKKIASVLNAADKEIDVLDKKLESLKQQKKGLMQKLLTGKIRVKV